MNWNQLLSTKRLGSQNRDTISNERARTQFQKDYDRLIFSSPFRRLQNKTQVFPLPGSVFVHNRLTHSLEVASIGRSLGDMAAQELSKKPEITTDLIHELGAIVSTACLAHDLGNPPFGHSGESAISYYFLQGEGKKLQSKVSHEEWGDLQHFEGNANAFRILAHPLKGRRKGGYALTFSSLAALVKYPFPSNTVSGKKKYGFFRSEQETFEMIADELGIPCFAKDKGIYARHPLVYLVEAADDIAYQIMDLEDAHKLRILTTDDTKKLFLNFFNEKENSLFFEINESVSLEVTDPNEQVAFLRASVISKLINETLQIFLTNQKEILSGTFQGSLVSKLPEQSSLAMKAVSKISIEKIYKHPEVISIEISGFNILGTLLTEFVPAVLNSENEYYKKLLSLIPEQYQTNSESVYNKIQTVLDFVSNMTDLFAVKIYRDIKGITSN
jgi:dGTPase